MVNGGNTITISFKPNSEKDQKLKSWIKSHSGYSAFLKDILTSIMEGENFGDPGGSLAYSKPKKEEEKEVLLDLTDL